MLLLEDAVMYTQLHDVAGASSRLEVGWKVGHQVLIEHPHLITGSIRYDHLGQGGHVPLVQLRDHPLGNVEGGVALSKGDTAKDKCLALPRWSDVV